MARFFLVFGRAPLFFYVLHCYLLKVLETTALVLSGRPWTDTIKTAETWNSGTLPHIDLGLPAVYAAWAFVIAVLYPVCKRYMEYKARNRSVRWLSYL